jgi:hypothetical protein
MVGTNLAEHQGVLWSGTVMRVRDAYARARGSHADCARGGGPNAKANIGDESSIATSRKDKAYQWSNGHRRELMPVNQDTCEVIEAGERGGVVRQGSVGVVWIPGD